MGVHRIDESDIQTLDYATPHELTRPADAPIWFKIGVTVVAVGGILLFAMIGMGGIFAD